MRPPAVGQAGTPARPPDRSGARAGAQARREVALEQLQEPTLVVAGLSAWLVLLSGAVLHAPKKISAGIRVT